jgi:isopenicillin N synthase-like dioxygenase
VKAGGELPVVDVATIAPHALLAAFVEHGAVLAHDPSVPQAVCDSMLADLRWLFARSDADKATFAIAGSPHFRGHSRMHNERDHREQIHVGRERAPATAAQLAEGPHWRLQGPNLWPDDAGFRQRTLAYLDAVEGVGIRLLQTLGSALGLDAAAWLGDDPYGLGKGIGYHAQPHAGAALRGVAAHLDFSLVTLTLQDDVGGLEVRRPDGRWLAVPCRPATWLVNVGELLQYATGNQLVATPHRVVNPSRARTRCSFPVFVNPSLASVLSRPPSVVSCATNPAPGDDGHVHAVLDAQAPPATLPFGPAEWRRKGENVWCRDCCARR